LPAKRFPMHNAPPETYRYRLIEGKEGDLVEAGALPSLRRADGGTRFETVGDRVLW